MEAAGAVRGLTRGGRRIPPAVPAAIAGAWGLAVAAEGTGTAGLLHHDALIHSGLPLWAAAGLFLLAWQAMVAAMMLPSSLPMVRLFAAASRNQERPGGAMAAFLGGYAAVWSAFGALAFLADVAIHRAVDATPWLAARPWLIAAGSLALAGGFQFSSLKDKCLSECRHPAGFLVQHYARGAGAAFRMGSRHGLFCLGCCWALMLVVFGAGVANLWWMAGLGALMFYEKAGRNGDRIVPAAGLALLTLAALALAHPPWLPNLFGGGRAL